jgi:hypothetical protein
VVEEPVKSRKKTSPPEKIGPNDRLTLVFDTETTTDTRQELRFGIAQLYANGRLTRTLVFTGELTAKEQATVSTWAVEHNATILTVSEFVTQEFLPLAHAGRAVVVGFNLPFDLARIAAEWEPKRKVAGKRAWTLSLITRSNSRWAYVPRLRVERVSSAMSFIRFTGTKGRWRNYEGAFVDLRTFVRALTGEKHSLKSAGDAFACVRKKTEADYGGPVTPRFLDYGLNDVELTWELYQKCRGRYATFGLKVHPSRLYSSATLAKSLWEERGIVPPKLTAKLNGRLMAAFYAGKVENRVRAREVREVAVLDFTSQYPSLYCLLGAERFLTAQSIRTRVTTEDVRNWVDGLTFEDLLRRETWVDARMWTLCEVGSEGAILPIRSTFDGNPTEAPTIGWNHVTTEPGLTLPYMVADVLAAKLLGGTTPRIVRATTFEPVGRQEVQPVKVLGVEVGPGDGLIQTLVEARIIEKRDKTKGWKHRADGLKTICNAGSYGIFVEVNRQNRSGRVRIHGVCDEPYERDEDEVEVPGSDYCPLVGASLTSSSHLLLAIVESLVGRLGGQFVYCDTDSAFVSPSKIVGEVAAALEHLNPYSVLVPFLKDETTEFAPKEEYPPGCLDTQPSFYGLSSKRYCLFVRTRDGRPYVFRGAASDHGLGSYQVGRDRDEWVAQLWERIIEKGIGAADDYAGVPATSEFSLSTPNLLPRIRRLGDIRPFTFLTARLLEPSRDPDETRSELVAFIGPDDNARRAGLMNEPRQRSWGSVVEDFVRHRDRKYTFDADGQAVRRHGFVRRKNLVGLGKEANRVEDSKVLGLAATKGRAKRYVDPDPFEGSSAEVALRLGITRRAVLYRRRVTRGAEVKGGGTPDTPQREAASPGSSRTRDNSGPY